MSEIHEVKGRCGKNLMQVKIWKQGGVVKCLEGNGTILTYPKPSKIKISQLICEICDDCVSINKQTKRMDE